MKELTIIGIFITSVCLHAQILHAQLHYGERIEHVTKNITNCDVALNFSNMGLNIINPRFISNPYIKTLALKSNGINKFQEYTFDSLPSLENLDLSNNELTSQNLFSFGNLYALKSLTLDYNPHSLLAKANTHQKSYDRYETSDYDDYPRAIYDNRYRGRNYDRNYVSCNEDQYYSGNNECKYYSKLEIQHTYPNLTHLSIRSIFINSLASDWSNHFPNLTHLDISENDFHKTSEELFSRLPASLTSLVMRNVRLTIADSSKLKNLTHLDLNDNKFETLSSHYCYENTLCLKNLTKLETLNIANCSIRKIETDAFKDTMKLNYLDMSHNDFEEIPDGTFEFLPALSHLNLSSNKFTLIPNFSYLKNLTSLYMDNMQNRELLLPAVLEKFSQIPTLEILSLRFNGLVTIPTSFLNKFTKLRELDLSNNKITLLTSWKWQNNLHKISLGDNEIENLEDISLKEANSLKLIKLENNKFTEIKLKYLKYLPDDVVLKI